MKNKIQIRNQWFSERQILSHNNSTVQAELYVYRLFKNCWPDLWAKDSELSEMERICFIYLATHPRIRQESYFPKPLSTKLNSLVSVAQFSPVRNQADLRGQ